MSNMENSLKIYQWEIAAIRNGIKSVLIYPQQQLQASIDSLPTKDSTVTLCNYDGLFKFDATIVSAPKIITLHDLTEQDAIDFGVAELYPASDFGGTGGFYLPEKILEVSAKECFEHYWQNNPVLQKYPLESNPVIIIFEFEISNQQ